MNISNTQSSKLLSKLKGYSKTYLQRKSDSINESATRLIVNHFLTEVLDLVELEEIKTEYAIKGTYSDYVIQLNRKKHLVIEVKAMQLDITENHLRQAISYAANEGIDWVLLTNAREFELYKVFFRKPIEYKKVFSLDLTKLNDPEKCVEFAYLISKKGLLANELAKYWARYQSLEPENLAKTLYEPEILKLIKKKLKNKSGIIFSDEDIIDSVYRVIVEKVPSQKPKIKKAKSAKSVRTIAEESPKVLEVPLSDTLTS